MARRRLIAGNWKMNLTHLEAIGLVQTAQRKPALPNAAKVSGTRG